VLLKYERGKFLLEYQSAVPAKLSNNRNVKKYRGKGGGSGVERGDPAANY